MSEATPRTEILIIDDENQIRRLLRFTLENAGYAVREADCGRIGLVELAHRAPQAVLLDLGLPDMRGVDVLRRLREWTDLPVLILSVYGEEGVKIEALDAGADDYLTKPFAGGELLARLRALLRRARTTDEHTALQFGQVQVDMVQRRVTKGGVQVRLTAKEYALLRLLLTHRDKVLTHSQILTELWGPEASAKTHYLRVFMMRLRRKIEDEPDAPRHLLTESNIGYRLVSEAT